MQYSQILGLAPFFHHVGSHKKTRLSRSNPPLNLPPLQWGETLPTQREYFLQIRAATGNEVRGTMSTPQVALPLR